MDLMFVIGILFSVGFGIQILLEIITKKINIAAGSLKVILGIVAIVMLFYISAPLWLIIASIAGVCLGSIATGLTPFMDDEGFVVAYGIFAFLCGTCYTVSIIASFIYAA